MAGTAGALVIAAALAAPVALSPTPARADEPIPPPPSPAQCAATRPSRQLPALQSYDPGPGYVRVFAMQYKQELVNVQTYASFRTKIECLIREYVVPHLAPGRPNIVAFNEEVGLMTLATGSRGAQARTLFASPGPHPSCESQGAPCGTVAAFGAVSAGYSRQLAYYRTHFPDLPPIAGTFVAATDTFVRGFMQTFSDMARRYGIYILGSNSQAPFRLSTDPADIAALSDPDYPAPPFVYVATEGHVYNDAFLWSPRDVRSDGPPPVRNLVASNLKIPLTATEQQFQFTPGPATGPAAVDNLRAYRVPGSEARLGFATSLPAFVYGDPPAGTDPCSDVSLYYMRCLNKLGANVLVQDEANDGRWAANAGCSGNCWQPLEWMASAWRSISDPTVGFAYAVNPMMVGNLADLPFDGQSAIAARGLAGGGCNYIGDAQAQPGDPTAYHSYAGPRPGFLAIAPWVVPDASRSQLSGVGAKLAPGSGDALENDYVETAVIADLTFPADPHRPACLTEPGSVMAPGGSPGAPGAAPVAQPFARVAGRRVPVRGHRALVRVSCGGSGGSTCRGQLLLSFARPAPGRAGRHRPIRAVLLGRARFAIPAGAIRGIAVRLNAKARKLVDHGVRRATATVRATVGPARSSPVLLLAAAPRR
ncbi:MAG TPA: hypothetical protein VGY97_02470 [Solirubrobacteraceae bacterium]|nr:hypothetical protein [Solirubrobacteraceae bacterium]